METLRNFSAHIYILIGPTRWGNQLNGNFVLFHLLLLNDNRPTRWGNQLNGNTLYQSQLPQDVCGCVGSPTRWGNQLNGNNGHRFDCT